MRNKILLTLIVLSSARVPAQVPSTYVPGVTYQTDNPHYFKPNPFYFEGRIDWNLLKIDQPINTWDYMQRGLHYQDDLRDAKSAIADYQKSISMNSLANGTCQIVTTAVTIPASGELTPAPCIFTVRLRLAGLLKDQDPQQAISLYREVLAIDPLRLNVHEHIAEIYETMAAGASSPTAGSVILQSAVAEYQAELALSPVTALETTVTGDSANNAHVHWALAHIYETLGQTASQRSELELYLSATKWHSDVYPWRIAVAQSKISQLRPATPAHKLQ